MNTRRSFAFGFVAALLSLPFAATADAASRRRSRRMAARSHRRMASSRTGRGTDSSQDAAVDALNAQSLARARGADQGGMPQGPMGGQGGMQQ